MFIAFVGLKNAKLVVANPATLVSIGSFSDREVQTACFGLVLMLILIVRKVKGTMRLGILGITLLGIFRGMSRWPTALVSIPHPSLTFLKFDLHGALHLGLFEIMFIFLFVDLLDNVDTLVAVCEQAGFVKDGKTPRVGRALLADAVGTVSARGRARPQSPVISKVPPEYPRARAQA
jgi:AGZA family xanthine/uracil permease-like MFS transporter